MANILAPVLPGLSARISHRFWAATKRYDRPAREQACFQKATRQTMVVDGCRVAIYKWGSGPKVLCIHGWNGRATQYVELIDRLITSGYSVVGFDAPGHGNSDGNQTTLKQMMDIVGHLQNNHGVFDVIVGHSFGFFVAVNVWRQAIQPKCFIGISSPADFTLLLKAFISNFGLNKVAAEALANLLKQRYNAEELDDISIQSIAREISVPCLLLHAESDNQVPLSEPKKILYQWQGAELTEVKRCGHSSILRDRKAMDMCVRFLNRSAIQ